jgi:hypothetical protein
MALSAKVAFDLLASRNDEVIIGEAKRTPSLGTKTQRVSKAKRLAMVAHVLHTDQILALHIRNRYLDGH